MPLALLPGGVERRYWVGPRTVTVCEPATQAYGHTVVEFLHGAAIARERGTDIVFAHDSSAMNPALFELESEDLRILRSGSRRSLALACYRLQKARPTLDEFRRELAGEIGQRMPRDDTPRSPYPKPARAYLKRRRGALAGTPSSQAYFRRRLLAEPARLRLQCEGDRRAREEAAQLGLDPESPVVCLHVREPGFKSDKIGQRVDYARNASLENHFPACDGLVAQGYTVVRLGDPSMVPLDRKGYVDLATSPRRSGLLELHCVLRADLLVVGESGPNVLGYLADTPILCLNATDPISSYPIRTDGHVLFKRVIDRATGERMGPFELLRAEHLARLRDVTRYRYIENTPEEIADALAEAQSWQRGERAETQRQSEFRARAVEIAMAQTRIAYVRKWGADDGFLGAGRAVDAQFEPSV